MFVHMSIHYPRPGQERFLTDSMHRFGAAIIAQPGCKQARVLRDQKTGRLIRLAIWDNKQVWLAARPTMEEAVKDDDFEAWEEKPPDVFHLNEI